MTPLRRHLASALAAIGLALALLGTAAPALAQTPSPTPGLNGAPVDNSIPVEVPIPQSAVETGVSTAAGTVKDAAQYISLIYNFAISVVGVIAAVMMIIGGFQYLTSAGDAGRIGAAKKRITDALIGLVLALGSFALLNSLNPALVNLKPLFIGSVKSQLTVMPWCNDLMAKGVAVTPLWGDPKNCGSVGQFMQGKTALTCLFRSECPRRNEGRDYPSSLPSHAFYSTCVQTTTTNANTTEPITADQILRLYQTNSKASAFYDTRNHCTGPGCGTTNGVPDAAFAAFIRDPANQNWTDPNGLKHNCGLEEGLGQDVTCDWHHFNDWESKLIDSMPDVKPGSAAAKAMLDGEVKFFAQCKSCLDYGAGDRSATSTVGSLRCEYWQHEANKGVDLGPSAWDKEKAAGRNELSICKWLDTEKGCAQADFTCKEPVATESCGNYNDIAPFVMFDLFQGGYVWWVYGSGKNGTLSARPDALENICDLNPCGYNPKTAKSDGGCTGSSGVVDGIRTAAAAVRDGIIGIQSCTNR